MHVIAFSASRTIPTHATERIEGVLKTLAHEVLTRPGDLVVTGACVGGDQMICEYLLHEAPWSLHRIVVPRDRSRVDEKWLAEMARNPRVEIVEMPRGTTYRDRNEALLRGLWPRRVLPAQRLVAFPLHGEKDQRSIRSGTWMTVRMARAESIAHDLYVLEP